MVIAVLEMVPQLGKREAIVEILQFVEGHVRLKADCLGCGVFEAADTPKILYLEQWRSARDLHTHIKSNLYRPILSAMELASEAPKISFHDVSETKSMELIESLRTEVKA